MSNSHSGFGIAFVGITLMLGGAILTTMIGGTWLQWLPVLAATVVILWAAQAIGS